MKISVIGAGYVGLVSSVCFAELGHSVNLIELEKNKIDLINLGKPPIYEKGLEEILSKHLGYNLAVTSSYDAVPASDVSFICVGTPSDANGNADLSMITSASMSIGAALQNKRGYHVIVVKSTVPPGTTQNIVMPLVLENSIKDVHEVGFVMNPEFLREGRAIEDFLQPDRIVIGSFDDVAGDFVASIYEIINSPLIRTGLTEAEMVKYASNAFLAAKISFSNEVGNICKRLGIDVYEVMRGVGLDHRISPHFLNAGAGFGGSCFPKDVSALIHLAESLGEDPILLKSVMDVNEIQPRKIIDLLEQRIGRLKGKRIAVLGLAFKDNTDDVRESRAIIVINELKSRGATVAAFDPKANSTMQAIISDIDYFNNAAEALKDADACIVMTEWPEFSSLEKEFDLMRSKVVLEGRRILSFRSCEGICW